VTETQTTPQTTTHTKTQTTRGRFITLEGVDGAGKSTHTDWLVAQLRTQLQAADVTVLSTREPGGTPLGERLRALVLSEPMTLEAETLLMFAARSEHVARVIAPALAAGSWVVCDRYTDATYAYQGGGRELGAARIAALESSLDLPEPDLTWLFDVPLDVARVRMNTRTSTGPGQLPDRFEREDAEFFARTRAAYHARANAAPQRIRVIDATLSVAAIRATLAAQLDTLIADWRRG